MIERNGNQYHGVKYNENRKMVCEICGTEKKGKLIYSRLENFKCHEKIQCECGNIKENFIKVDFIY